MLLGRHINIGLDLVHRLDRRRGSGEGNGHTTRCLKPFIMYELRCAECEGNQCRSVLGGSGPEVREPAPADRWSQGDGEAATVARVAMRRGSVEGGDAKAVCKRVSGEGVVVAAAGDGGLLLAVCCLSSRSTCYAKPNRAKVRAARGVAISRAMMLTAVGNDSGKCNSSRGRWADGKVLWLQRWCGGSTTRRPHTGWVSWCMFGSWIRLTSRAAKGGDSPS